MWNRNNPYSYADPSGYCLEDACVVEGAVVVGGAELAAAGAEAVGEVELAGPIRGGLSVAQRAAAKAFEEAGGCVKGAFRTASGRRRIADNLTKTMVGEAKRSTS